MLQGNVRDSAYIRKDRGVVPGFSALIRQTAKELGFDQAVSWGVFFDHEDQGDAPAYSSFITWTS